MLKVDEASRLMGGTSVCSSGHADPPTSNELRRGRRLFAQEGIPPNIPTFPYSNIPVEVIGKPAARRAGINRAEE